MKKFQIEIPELFSLEETDTKRFLASKLYEEGKLTLGQAAQLAGLSQIAFSEILADYGVSLFNYDPSEIAEDASRI